VHHVEVLLGHKLEIRSENRNRKEKRKDQTYQLLRLNSAPRWPTFPSTMRQLGCLCWRSQSLAGRPSWSDSPVSPHNAHTLSGADRCLGPTGWNYRSLPISSLRRALIEWRDTPGDSAPRFNDRVTPCRDYISKTRTLPSSSH
jgi:hypothetical protein